MAYRRDRSRAGCSRRGWLAAVLGALAIAAPAGALDAEDVLHKSFDLAIVRPMNLAATAAGAGFFAISAPPLIAGAGVSSIWSGFEWPPANLQAAYDTFILAPYEYTFQRPLGDL